MVKAKSVYKNIKKEVFQAFITIAFYIFNSVNQDNGQLWQELVDCSQIKNIVILH